MSKIEVRCREGNTSATKVYNVDSMDLVQLVVAKGYFLSNSILSDVDLLHHVSYAKSCTFLREIAKDGIDTETAMARSFNALSGSEFVFIQDCQISLFRKDLEQLQNIAEYKQGLQDQIDARIRKNRQILAEIHYAEASHYDFDRLYGMMFDTMNEYKREIAQLSARLNSLQRCDSLVRLSAALGGHAIEIL